MALRLHEIHASVVHFPLALFPAAWVADLTGRLSGNPSLMRLGGKLMAWTARTGAVAALAGLVAQEAVDAKGRSHDVLITHRNLNIGLVLAVALLAVVRRKQEKPGLRYLSAGAAGILAMSYSAYLGGEMVYRHGLGVEPAGGVRAGASPEIKRGSLADAAGVARRHAIHGLKHASRHAREGEIAPALRPK